MQAEATHKTGKKIKLKLSLTKRRTKVINYTYTITELVPGVKFAYVDVNGNLKIPST